MAKADDHGLAPLPFRRPAQFMCSAPKTEFIPESDLSEVAIIGRSNVGKSSLINALLGIKDMARTSKTPGRTRELNFFNMGGIPYLFTIVDLPGYGYAKISKKDQKQWAILCHDYLSSRVNLKRVFLLIDSRHPMKDTDEHMLKMLASWRVPVTIVLTKCDQSKKKEQDWHMAHQEELLKSCITLMPDVFRTSSSKRLGLHKLQQEILSAVGVEG